MNVIILYISLLLIPVIILIGDSIVKTKYTKIKNNRVITGCEVCHDILDNKSFDSVYVVNNKQNLNLYDSNRKVIKLSDDVFDETTLYAVSVGIMKATEAVNDNKKNKMMHLRDSLRNIIPMVNLLSYILFIIGVLADISICEIALALLILVIIYNIFIFKYEDLVKDNALKLIKGEGYIDKEEREDVKRIMSSYRFHGFDEMITSIINVVDALIPNSR